MASPGGGGHGADRPPPAPLDGITVDSGVGGGGARAQGMGLPRPPGWMRQPSRLASGVRQFASRVSMKVPDGVAAGIGIRPGGLGRMTRMQSGAQMGLRGLRFLDKTSGGKEGWKAVERRFDEMSKGGLLPKESFGKCIGEYLASLATTDRQWSTNHVQLVTGHKQLISN
jgi:hypothetical protein